MGSIRCNETSKIVQAQGHGIQSNQSQSMAGTSGTGDRKYDWQSDAKACYEYALRMIALRIGSRQGWGSGSSGSELLAQRARSAAASGGIIGV